MNKKTWGSAPLHETTENLQFLNIDKRTLKKTGRIHLFATRVKKEWIEQLKAIAYEERLKYVEVLEKALEVYKTLSKNSLAKPKKQPKPKLNQFWKVTFDCDKCYQRFEKGIVFSPSPNLDQLNNYPTYCANCKEEKNR